MRIDICNNPVRWREGEFVPQGCFKVHGKYREQNNPRTWTASGPTYAARIIVGFKRKGKRAATLDSLVRVVRRVRQEQVGDPSSSFLTQRGIYRHGSGKIVDEPGAQVVLINVPQFNTTPKKFEAQVEELAEAIVVTLEQDEVIVEIQRDGRVVRSFGVGR